MLGALAITTQHWPAPSNRRLRAPCGRPAAPRLPPQALAALRAGGTGELPTGREYDAPMQEFIEAHQDKIAGVLSCFDRMLFRGYLPIQDGWAFAKFLGHHQIRFRSLKDFLISRAEVAKRHAKRMAEQAGRAFQYLSLSAVSRHSGRPRSMGLERKWAGLVLLRRSQSRRDLVGPFPPYESNAAHFAAVTGLWARR